MNSTTNPIKPVIERSNGSPPLENCLITTGRDKIIRMYNNRKDLFIIYR